MLQLSNLNEGCCCCCWGGGGFGLPETSFDHQSAKSIDFSES